MNASSRPDDPNPSAASMTGRGRWILNRLRGPSLVALIDQAITSGANFATVVIIGRAAGADALGVYSLGFTLLMLVAAAQESLVSSPYTFFGHRVDGADRRALAGSSLVHALGLMILSTLLLAATALGLGPTPLADVLWVLSVMSPMMLAREFGRKFAFADLRMHVALGLDAIAAAVQIGGLMYLAWSGNLQATSAFLVAGLACGVASGMWLIKDRRAFHIDRSRVVEHWRSNWQFGRWVFAGVVTILLHINVVRWLIAFGIDNAAAGVFAACMAIAMLATPFIQGMNNVLLPRAAKAFHQSGRAAVRQVVWQTTVYVLMGMAVFALLMFAAGGWAVSVIYGAEYGGNHVVVCLLVSFMISRAIDTSLYNGIWALERPEANVRINLVAMAATVAITLAMMSYWGIVGAAIGLLVGDLCGTFLRGMTFLSLASGADTFESSLELGAE